MYTHGYEEPKVDVSKTTFAYSRDAIKLVPTTNPITTTLAGKLTQELSSQYEVYEYSPNGLGNRIYYKQIWDRRTWVQLDDIAAKNVKLLVELPDGFSYDGNDSSVKTIENYNNSGKTVLEVTPWNQNSRYPLSPNLRFKVDDWVESGKYPVKYTLVWNEDERLVGINPNNDYDGTNATITNTSTFTYELPVINNSATRLITQVTDQPTDSSTYSTGAYNLAPNDEVKYRLSLTNSSNAAIRNNVVISTLPRVSDKNIVLNSKDRGSQFDVHLTAAATVPEGWTAYYSTTPVSGTAVELEKAITLTANQITDWSTVTAVKFVSNQDASLKEGATAAFYLPAKVSSTATNNQVAVLTSATRTDGQDTFNETNPARISIKIEDVKKGAVKVAYENKDNALIKDTVTAIESRAYKKGYDVDTQEYKPDTLIGKDGKKYYFVKVKENSPSPTGTINSPEVTVTYVYDLLYDETEESHTATRTIKYIDAEKKTQVADPVTQTATIKRVNKVNRKTKEVIEGTWSTASWDEKISPIVTNYNAPNREKVGIVPITSITKDVTEIIEYTQAVDTKTVATKQTVTYEGAGASTPAPNEQTDYTFTGKTNKVTNVTTWNEQTHTYGVVTTPKVEGYYADKAQAGGKEVTPTNPEASDKVVYKPLGKVILVDEGGNEIPNTQKPTYKNNPNDPTVGGETPIPEIPDGYEIKPKQDVPGFNPERKVVTPPKPGEDTRIVLVEVNQKATVRYVVEGTNTVLHTDKLEGKSGEPIKYTTATKLAELKALGYELVTDGFVTATDKNFDKDTKVDQDFMVTVAKTVPVTPTTPQNPNEDPQNPKPGDPIDPKNPNGPKWTKEALDKLNNIKSVIRTITYIKDGTTEEVSPTEAPKWTDKVSFTRTVVVNPKDGSVVGYDTTGDGIADVVATDTTSGWKAAGTAKFAERTSPVVKGYVVKPNQDTQGDLVEADGSKVKASATDLTVDSANQDLKVRYVPVGKLVPKVPEGVTPPTPVTPTPYENVPGDPGKVVPPSPTKPTDPKDPNSPKVPVIPHIPGTIPQVPKDPTKPVDPNTNPLVPLEPVTPGKPEDGYKVPPVPTDPTANTPVNYVKGGQKAITNFIDNNGKVVSDPVFDQGGSGTRFTKSREVESKIKELVKKGYIVVSNDYPSVDTDRVFDNDKDKDQIFNVKVTPLIVPTDPNSPDKPMVPTDPTKPVGPNNPLRPVTPSTPDPGEPVFPEDPNSPVWPNTVKDLVTETAATRIITYVDQNEKEVAATHTETIKFKRSAKVNLVTGEITYGDWTVVGDDSILDGNPLPHADGYIARGGDIDASQEDIKATAGMNITQTVVYDKLGSWVPKVPEGATPVPPITYPNDPKDPTKPGTDKPRVPHVPGFIPVGPNGTPLKPVDPKDPSKGYKVPDVPKDPTKDTPISYVPVTPEKPTPERKTPKPTPVVLVQPEGPVTPKTPDVPTKPTRLANTGTTETNTGLAGLGILGGLLAAARRRKEKNDD